MYLSRSHTLLSLTIVLFSAAAADTSVRTINITNGEQLKEYLCSLNRTIAPNTHLKIVNTRIEMENLTNDCLVENTSNIFITSSCYNSEFDTKLAVVYCSDNLEDVSTTNTFSFFNVTNLTISSVLFYSCGWKPLSPAAFKYINGSDQIFEYGFNLLTTFLLNHCNNVTLHNVFADSYYRWQVHNRTSVVGVNLCGHNNISSILPRDYHVPLVTLSIYYVDSSIMSGDTECTLHIQSNMLSANKHNSIVQLLEQGAEKLPVIPFRDLAVIAAQEKFKVDINMEILPMLYGLGMKKDQYCTHSFCAASVLIMFINDENNTHIMFQGYPYEFCTDPSSTIHLPHPDWHIPLYRPIQLDVIFYSTSSHSPSGEGILSPLLIQNTSFMYYDGLSPAYDEDNHVVHILQFSAQKSYHVEFEKTAWCNNSIFFDVQGGAKWCHQLLTYGLEDSNGVLYLIMNDVFVKNNLYNIYDHEYEYVPSFKDDRLWQCFSGSMMLFINTDVTISGNSYIGQNFEGSAISAVSSNLTITGNLTIRDGYSYYGGGVRLDSYSYLFLKEPLHAQFINNSAKQGSAIYAPVHTDAISSIQIWPNDVYTHDNLTSISISLCFTEVVSLNTAASLDSPSLYAPSFNFENRQISPYLHLNDDIPFSTDSSYHFKELLDTIIDSDEKFHLLSNGYCKEVYPEKNSPYSDYLLYAHDLGKKSVTVYPGEMAVSLHDAVNVEVCYKQCPLGFEMNQWGVCICAHPHRLLKLNFKCDINTQSIVSPPYHWMGLIYYEHYPQDFMQNAFYILLSTNCPPGYCSNNVSMRISDFHDSSFPCLNNRSGILCGQCKDNLSIVFGSDECRECSHLYLLTLPVYAVAGLLLVVLLFALRLTVATGTINGLIFYANILDLSMDVFSRDITNFYMGPLRIIISLLNLNLGFPLCLYDGMTTAAKAGLQFVFPVYLWSIVVGLIIAARYSTRLANVIPQSSVQVLATLFYLSFSKLVQATVYIVSSSTIFSIEAVKYDYPDFDPSYDYRTDNYTIWLYDGMPYNSSVHCFLLIMVSMFAVLFILPYTMLLTFPECFIRFGLINKIRTFFDTWKDPLKEKCRSWSGHQCLVILRLVKKIRLFLDAHGGPFKDKIPPFLDAYGSPFKDKWRFWFGLRLWIIVILLSINGTLQRSNVDKMLVANFIVILLFILLQAHVSPFQSRAVGLFDVSFMINYLLIVLFYLSFANTDIMIFQIAYILLVSLAVLSFFVIVLIYYWIYPKSMNYFAMLKRRVNWLLADVRLLLIRRGLI